MKKKYYILIAVASYILFLIATIPAQPFANLINNNAPLNIQGVSGTLWNGKAYSVSIDPDTVIKDTHWSLSLWQIIIGRIYADINSKYMDNLLNAEIGTSIFGNYFINDLTATIGAKDVMKFANIPLAQLSGSFAVDIKNAQWSEGELPQADGTITWNSAAVTIADTIQLGNVNILLAESEQGLLSADIKNNGGDIAITGTAQLIPEADYAVDIKLTPTATASNNVIQSLGLFAKRQKNGSYLFKNAGPLKQIGLM